MSPQQLEVQRYNYNRPAKDSNHQHSKLSIGKKLLLKLLAQGYKLSQVALMWQKLK